MKELNVEGLAISPNVVETIVSIAASEVEGVACIGSAAVGGIRGLLTAKPFTQGIAVSTNEEDRLEVSVRMEVYYGHSLTKLADNVRVAISDALAQQVGLGVDKIDIYIDGLQFSE